MSSAAISSLLDQTTLGKCVTRTFTGTAVRFQLAADTATLPKVFLVYTDQDCHVRMGDATIVATTSDTLVKADTYVQIVVRSLAESYLSVIQVDTNGTLRATDASSKAPGTGVSGAAA